MCKFRILNDSTEKYIIVLIINITIYIYTGSEIHKKNALHDEGNRHLNKGDSIFFW